MPSLTKVQTGFLDPQGALELIPGTASAPGLRFSTSSATGMFSPSAGVLGFSTGSTQNALTILGGGNVGIGTTNPTTKLHVFGSNGDTGEIRLQSSDGRTYALGSTGSGYGSASNFIIYDITGSVERFRLTSSGNIGIGTTNPSLGKLHIEGGAIFARKNTSSIMFDDYNGGSIIWMDGSDGDMSGGDYWGVYAQNSTLWGVNYAGNTNILNVTSTGNVGIKTTNPSFPLEVVGGNNGIIVGKVLNGQYGAISVVSEEGNELNLGYARNASNYGAQTTAGDFSIKTTASRLHFPVGSGNANSVMVLTSGGTVGIGITNPQSKLHVSGPGNAPGGNIIIGTVSDGQSKWSYLTSTHYNSSVEPEGFTLIGGLATATSNSVVIGGNIFESNPSTEIQFWTHTATNHTLGGSEKVRITGDGNIGIGLTNPSSKIHVYGSNLRSMVQSTDASFIASGQWDGVTNRIESSGRSLLLTTYTGSINLGISGTTNFTVANNGRIGIGTTDPQDTLHVYGSNSDIIISNSSTGSAGLYIRYLNGTQHGTNLLYNPGSAVTYLDNTYPVVAGTVYGDMYFRQSVGGTMTNRITIKGATGRIGIGTDTPSFRLDVNGTFRAYNGFSSYVNDGLYGATANPCVITTPNEGLLLVGYYSNGDGNYYPRFGTSNSNSTQFVDFGAFGPNTFTIGTNKTEALRINASGNVGIGTNNPTTKLHVQGNTYITGALTAESYGYARFFTYDAPASPDGTGYVWIRASMGGFNGGGDVVKFSLGRAIWENNSSPYGGPLLDVTGAYSREWHSGQEFFTATYGYHGSVPGSGWVLNAGTRDLAGGGYWFYLRLYAGVRYYFRYPMSSGYISPTWEQTTDPGAIPTLNYGFNILGNLSNISASLDIIAGGNITAYGSVSDRKLKENINPLSNTLDKVLQLKPVTFDWKEGTQENKMVGLKNDIGLIAQEVQEVFPELVRESADGCLSVRERGLTAILIQAIKEQQNQINDLQNQLSNLTNN